MNDFTPKYGQKNFNIVKKNTIKQLLQLEQGRFPSKRINNFNDMIVCEEVHPLSNEAHFNCDSCG